MRKRNNPIPKEHQRPRHIGFADEEQEALPRVEEDWDRNCDGETYENLDLRHIDFTDASLVGTSFINCDLRGVAFLGSNISDTNFQGSDLRNANFKFIEILENADFENCNLSGAIFGERGNYTTCKWNNTNIEKTNFRDRSFLYVYLRIKKDPNLSIFIHGTPTFKNINLIGANIPSANLQGLNLQGAVLQYVKLQGAKLQGADLVCANLRGAFLNGANLQGADLENANLRGANLRGANLRGADLEFANLKSADIENANLENANLQGAYYDANTIGLTDEQKAIMLESFEDEDDEDY